MTLDNEAHREFLANVIRSAPVQGRVDELRLFVKTADDLLEAIQQAAVIAPEPAV